MTQRELRKRRHPGGRRRFTSVKPKGRQTQPEALEQVQTLLGQRSRQRDLLIEHLHLIQDAYGALSADHLAALAEEMRLALSEIYETASFYAHFDIVTDETGRPPPLTIRVCDSLTCELMGSARLLDELPDKVGAEVRVVRAPCMGRCDTAPVAEVGHRHIDHATIENLTEAAESRDPHPVIPDYQSLNAYEEAGGYALLADCVAGNRTPDELVQVLSDAGCGVWGALVSQPGASGASSGVTTVPD